MKKKIQLCGFGNGLVDLQYQVSYELLNTLGLKKGDMILVGEDEQTKLLEQLEGIPYFRCSGGSGANSVIAFAQLGGSTAYQTVLGNDEFGKFYANEFHQIGIKLSPNFISEHKTGTCIVLITPDGERTMHTYLGATAYFDLNCLDYDVIKDSEWLYIEGYEFSQQSSTEAIFKSIEFAKQNNTKIALSFSADFIINVFRDNLNKISKDVDLVFCNESEAMNFTQTNDYNKAFEGLCDIFPNVVVTLGKDGAIYKWNNDVYRVPTYPNQVVDTTGAGDMFAGSFFYGIINDNSPIKAGHLASYTSGKIVSQFGARLNVDIVELKNKLYQEIIPFL